jgi:glycosyltransferase 2 family protein
VTGRREPEGLDDRRVTSAPRWSAIVGVIIGVAGATFVVRSLIQNWDSVSEALGDAEPAMLVVALVAGALGMTGIGLGWHNAVRILGSSLPLLSSLRGYFVGQLGKYVPGGVWAIMGRGEWARHAGVPASIAYTSVLMSMGSAYLAALLLATLLLPFSDVLASDGGSPYVFVIILLPIGLALIHPRILRGLFSRVSGLSSREVMLVVPPWRSSALLVLQQIPSWIFIGGASLALSTGLGDSGDPANVIFATAIAWIVGFLALPTPGGLGVREAVFVAVATSLPAGIAAAVAILARVVFIVVDASGAGLTHALMARAKRRSRVSP